MGMFDYLTCEYPLPDGFDAAGVEFQTKDLDNTLEHFTITADGRLVAHRVRYEVVPEEERPLYGTARWESEPWVRVLGSLRAVPVGDEVLPHHGDVEFYSSNIVASGPEGVATADDAPIDIREYTARFTNGRLEWIRGGRVPFERPQLSRAELGRHWAERARSARDGA